MSKYRILYIEFGEFLHTDIDKEQIYSELEIVNASDKSDFPIYEDSKENILIRFEEHGIRNSIRSIYGWICVGKNPELFELVEVPDV